jgi:hypothetical protein
LKAAIARRVRETAKCVNQIDICGTMPLNVPRHWPGMQSLNAPDLCYACAIFGKEKCLKHGEFQEHRHVYIVQNQRNNVKAFYLEQRNNVKAFYLEHERA